VGNLRTTKYSNGDVILNETNSTVWSNLWIGAWVYYNHDSAYDSTYGKLYNWFATVDNRNICPTSWHVPSDNEWTTLINHLGGESVAGGKMKEAGFAHWQWPNSAADNSSGFTALPGGYRTNAGQFEFIGYLGGWWSTAGCNTNEARGIGLSLNDGVVGRNLSNKRNGFSVRCLKD
jgi:uncharacterized protein (TIGR02145 family)